MLIWGSVNDKTQKILFQPLILSYKRFYLAIYQDK